MLGLGDSSFWVNLDEKLVSSRSALQQRTEYDGHIDYHKNLPAFRQGDGLGS